MLWIGGIFGFNHVCGMVEFGKGLLIVRAFSGVVLGFINVLGMVCFARLDRKSVV